MPRFSPLERNPNEKTQNGALAGAQGGPKCKRGPTGMQSLQTCAQAHIERGPGAQLRPTHSPARVQPRRACGPAHRHVGKLSTGLDFARSTGTFHAIHENWCGPGSFYRGLQLGFAWSDCSTRSRVRSDGWGGSDMIQVWPNGFLARLLMIE